MKSPKESDERSTPDELFLPLDNEFHFTLDPCSTHENAKCKKHYTWEEDGLVQSWKDEIVFMNPPYSNLYEWVRKARDEWATVICILPCDTSTQWFHDFLWIGDDKFQDTRLNVELRFPKGRYKFGSNTGSPMFATIIAVMR